MPRAGTLRQIGAELGIHWSTVGQQLQSAGVTMRRVGTLAHPASTRQILELRDQGLTWNEIADPATGRHVREFPLSRQKLV